jgi:protein-L-isoaspartate(D-aspartate) O-methyltransferase
MGITNVVVQLGDGTRGWPSEAPYDAIVVTAGGPAIPEPLLAQLAVGGRLIGPFGPRGKQQLMRVRRDPAGRLQAPELLGAARFVDLVGEHGWGD